ncbi:unnamed protein product [Heterobilharzia americana]|nr:unnamed protein product [Heterobilharzia americana]
MYLRQNKYKNIDDGDLWSALARTLHNSLLLKIRSENLRTFELVLNGCSSQTCNLPKITFSI